MQKPTLIDDELDRLARPKLVEALNELTLPLMWSLRQAAFRAFEPLGIRPIKALLLELIANGMAHPKDLSDVLDTVPPAISAMLGELEGKGLISRGTDPSDRRRVRLALTGKGERLRTTMRGLWRDTGQERLDRLDDADLRTLVRIYRTLLRS